MTSRERVRAAFATRGNGLPMGSWLILAALLVLPSKVQAQKANVQGPVRPSLESTTHRHDRGTDVVEPAAVLKVTYRAGRTDTTFLGTAKIPDPRRREVGATAKKDLATGTLIRLGGAWIYNEEGLQQPVTFDPESEEYLVFVPGRHDDVESLQGVAPAVRKVGEIVSFELRALYEGAVLNPLGGVRVSSRQGEPRQALLKMKSTYPGGERVDLSVVLVPDVKPTPPPQAIRVAHRDTTIIVANLIYEVREEVRNERSWTAAAAVESGWGQAHLRTDLPSITREAYSGTGTAGSFYVSGDFDMRREQNRWRLSVLGTSMLVQTPLRDADTHQVGLYADGRFEHGTNKYFVVQLSGELADKQYQVFDWKNADYAGAVLFGVGHTSLNRTGLEKTRVEFLAGIRMGENRRIKMLETRDRARGLGPQASVDAQFLWSLGGGFFLRAGSDVRGYSIYGRGHRDRGFHEKGVLLNSELQIGREFVGVVPYVGLTNFWLIREAHFKEGYRYYENRLLFAPGMSLKMHL